MKPGSKPWRRCLLQVFRTDQLGYAWTPTEYACTKAGFRGAMARARSLAERSDGSHGTIEMDYLGHDGKKHLDEIVHCSHDWSQHPRRGIRVRCQPHINAQRLIRKLP